jgi:hypothetical protein
MTGNGGIGRAGPGARDCVSAVKGKIPTSTHEEAVGTGPAFHSAAQKAVPPLPSRCPSVGGVGRHLAMIL